MSIRHYRFPGGNPFSLVIEAFQGEAGFRIADDYRMGLSAAEELRGVGHVEFVHLVIDLPPGDPSIASPCAALQEIAH